MREGYEDAIVHCKCSVVDFHLTSFVMQITFHSRNDLPNKSLDILMQHLSLPGLIAACSLDMDELCSGANQYDLRNRLQIPRICIVQQESSRQCYIDC